MVEEDCELRERAGIQNPPPGAAHCAVWVIGRGWSSCLFCSSIKSADTQFAPAKQGGAVAEIRWFEERRYCGALQPLPALALTRTGDALAACLVPGRAVLDPCCRGRIHPEALHHLIHQ